jgi:hypothetical protein
MSNNNRIAMRGHARIPSGARLLRAELGRRSNHVWRVFELVARSGAVFGIIGLEFISLRLPDLSLFMRTSGGDSRRLAGVGYSNRGSTQMAYWLTPPSRAIFVLSVLLAVLAAPGTLRPCRHPDRERPQLRDTAHRVSALARRKFVSRILTSRRG